MVYLFFSALSFTFSSWSEKPPGGAGSVPTGGFWPTPSRGEWGPARGCGLWRWSPLGLPPNEWSCSSGGSSCRRLWTVPRGELDALHIICLCSVTVICHTSAYKPVRGQKEGYIWKRREQLHCHFKNLRALLFRSLLCHLVLFRSFRFTLPLYDQF